MERNQYVEEAGDLYHWVAVRGYTAGQKKRSSAPFWFSRISWYKYRNRELELK